MAKQNTTQPEWSIRIGAVKGAIWKNTANDRTFYCLNLTRAYQDAEGNWVDSSSFGLSEALAAQKVLEQGVNRLLELSN